MPNCLVLEDEYASRFKSLGFELCVYPTGFFAHRDDKRLLIEHHEHIPTRTALDYALGLAQEAV